MKNGQKSSLYGEVSPYSEEIPYSERFSQIHYREYPLYPLSFLWKASTPKTQNPKPKCLYVLHGEVLAY